MTAETTTPPKSKASAFIEHLVSVVGIAYAFGFLVVLVNTAQLGIPLIILPQPVYVLLGLLPAAVITFPLDGYLWYLRCQYDDVRRRRTSTRLLLALISTPGKQFDSDDVRVLVAGIRRVYYHLGSDIPIPFFSLISNWVADFSLKSFDDEAAFEQGAAVLNDTQKAIRAQLEFVFRLVYWVTILLVPFLALMRVVTPIIVVGLGLMLYALLWYPNFTQAGGGGKATPVCLIISLEKIPRTGPYAAALFGNTDGAGSTSQQSRVEPKAAISQPLRLLYTTTDAYYIRTSNNTVIGLGHDAINGIIYLQSLTAHDNVTPSKCA